MLVLGSKLTLYVDSLCVTAIVPCVEEGPGLGLGSYVGGLAYVCWRPRCLAGNFLLMLMIHEP